MLSNEDGDGTATDWKLTLTAPPGGARILPVDTWDPRGVAGWASGETAEGWVATWTSTSADDTIGPGLRRSILVAPGANPSTFSASYAIRATGMKGRTGRLAVSIGEDPEREQTIEQT